MVEGRQRLAGAWGAGGGCRGEQWARADCVELLSRIGQVNTVWGVQEKEQSKVLDEALEKGSRIWLWEKTGTRSAPGSVAKGTEVGCLVS